MYLFIFIIIVFATIAFVVFRNPNERQNSNSAGTQQQPIHFDLLDDNGNPLPNEPVVQELQYFCVKNKGYHVSVWPKDQGFQGIDYIEFQIAGITHGEHIDDHLGEFVATLVPDPANPYDAKAIKILARNGDRVGYVPKDITSNVRAFTQLPCKCYCYIGKNEETYYTCCYLSNPV